MREGKEGRGYGTERRGKCMVWYGRERRGREGGKRGEGLRGEGLRGGMSPSAALL